MKLTKTLLAMTLSSCFSGSSYAVICMANQVDVSPKTLYLANNCQHFSGSKELRLNKSGALFNYNMKGNYSDQLYGSSYIYCPILTDDGDKDVSKAEIKVADLNSRHDVVCQLGKSQYTSSGFSAYWGKLAKSEEVGEQTLVAATTSAEKSKSMPNSFITCSLPPQDSNDDNASSLVAYSVKQSRRP